MSGILSYLQSPIPNFALVAGVVWLTFLNILYLQNKRTFALYSFLFMNKYFPLRIISIQVLALNENSFIFSCFSGCNGPSKLFLKLVEEFGIRNSKNWS